MAAASSPRGGTVQPADRVSLLADKLLAVDGALREAGYPHAFGGAIALAYCTREPRGTRDLDVNVFVAPDAADAVLDALPEGVTITAQARRAARRDGQVRVMWDDTPIDVFFDVHDFHREVAAGIVDVPFAGSRIKILGCDSLAIFKAMFNRTRDWADIEAMLAAGAMDGSACLARLRSLLGTADPAVVRLSGLL